MLPASISSLFERCLLLFCNLAWWLSCLPDWLTFSLASRNPEQAQQCVLRRILLANRTAQWLASRQVDPASYSSLPLSEYSDYRDALDRIQRGERAVLTNEPVLLLQPTSGSTDGTKLIPWTAELQAEFGRAINPWIWSLYRAWPKIIMGRQYWAISPCVPNAVGGGAVPVGFADDAAYLAPHQRALVRRILAVPAALSRVHDYASWQYLTLLFLARERNLRMISVWHPSFLIGLMKALATHLPVIKNDIHAGTIRADLSLSSELRSVLERNLKPDPLRAAELNPSHIWPQLQVISCWSDGWASHAIKDLSLFFPGVEIQGKGLLATEGIVTVPLGRTGQKVCAIRSHYLEFEETSGHIRRLHELEQSKTYSVLLTTGGGLYRYRLHDLVEVTGSFGRTPCLRFISRDDFTCDLVGEKLHLAHVEQVLGALQRRLDSSFAMLAPAPTRDRYQLFIQHPEHRSPALAEIATIVDLGLRENYHWAHARRLGQLEQPSVYLVRGDASERYRRHLIKQGRRPGDLKLLALRRETDWAQALCPD